MACPDSRAGSALAGCLCNVLVLQTMLINTRAIVPYFFLSGKSVHPRVCCGALPAKRF